MLLDKIIKLTEYINIISKVTFIVMLIILIKTIMDNVTVSIYTIPIVDSIINDKVEHD